MSNIKCLRINDNIIGQNNNLKVLFTWYSNPDHPNLYTISNNDETISYTVSFSFKTIANTRVLRMLRYHDYAKNNILFINFFAASRGYQINGVDNLDWVKVYNHFVTNYKYFINPKTKKPIFENRYFHEVFVNPSSSIRFFFDLDYENQDGLDELPRLLEAVKKDVGFEPKYIITKNSNNDFKRHIIFTNIIFKDFAQCKVFANHFKDFKSIDTQPYRKTGSLRTLLSLKENKKKIIDFKNCDNTDILSGLIQVNMEPTMRLITPNVGISDSDTCKLPCNEKEIKKLLEDLNYSIVSYMNDYIITLKRISVAKCQVCSRVHDKTDTNYATYNNFAIYLKCHRTPDASITIWKSTVDTKTFASYLKSIKPRSYEGLYDHKYNNPTPIIDLTHFDKTDAMYIASPCKSGKTKVMHDFIETHLKGKSILFITNLILFTRNLKQRFEDLGFNSYLDDDYSIIADRQIVSLYSLNKVCRDFDVVIIDEVESLISNFHSITQLGHESKREQNINEFIRLINNSSKQILLDAYPTELTFNVFKILGKKMFLSLNEFKTHENDTYNIYTDKNEFMLKMASALSKGEDIVFASANKKAHSLMMGNVIDILRHLPSWNEDLINKLLISTKYYSGDVDRHYMDNDIKNLDESWDSCKWLCYTSVITAGISYENAHFKRVFYYGNPKYGSINALQALYRVRDISLCEYNILFANSNKVSIRTEDQIIKDHEYYMNFNITFDNFVKQVILADTITNKLILKTSIDRDLDIFNYYDKFIGQLLYNNSTVKIFDKNDEEENVAKPSKNNKLQYIANFKCIVAKTPLKSTKVEDIKTQLDEVTFANYSNMVNRTSSQETIYRSNVYGRWFPKYWDHIKSGKHELFSMIDKNNKHFKDYHDWYNMFYNECPSDVSGYDRYVTNTTLCDKNPLMRYRLAIATELLSVILKVEHKDNLYCSIITESPSLYKVLHDSLGLIINADFKADIIRKAFIEVENKYNNDGQFPVMFNKAFYANTEKLNSGPMDKRSDRELMGAFEHCVRYTYNIEFGRKYLDVVIDGKKTRRVLKCISRGFDLF